MIMHTATNEAVVYVNTNLAEGYNANNIAEVRISVDDLKIIDYRKIRINPADETLNRKTFNKYFLLPETA